MKETATDPSVFGSFRDRSGFVFIKDGAFYRQINPIYKENYDKLTGSGLAEAIIQAELLIPHQEVAIDPATNAAAYKIIKPEIVPFVSYPYEWCFSQLKAAALATLNIQKIAIQHEMSLKDASAYNIQFRNGKPLLIDTISFEIFDATKPWIAYRQFCQHFLAPLVLMSRLDVRLNQLFRIFIDGPPLELASALLPFNTLFNFAILSHIHLHARSQKHFSGKPQAMHERNFRMNKLTHLALVDNLFSAIKRLEWKIPRSEWSDYYDETNYSDESLEQKKEIVAEFVEKVKPVLVWDLGANTGRFSRITASRGIQTVSFDLDFAAVEKNYRSCVADGEKFITPLLLDLTNPSPALGWGHRERMSLEERGPADVVLALALIHHLAISNNLPFSKIAYYFKKLCKHLIIEFVPKADSQVQRLLATREDIFPDYTQESFENEFSAFFIIHTAKKIKDTSRTVYWMESRTS